MKRFDYRREFKGLCKEKLEKLLTKYKTKLADNIGICHSNTEYYSKRVSYINKLLSK